MSQAKRPTMRAGGLGGGPGKKVESKRKHFSVSTVGSLSKPLTRAVDCSDMCYTSKLSESAKFSRNFDDSCL
jgi:hypothetical protein